MSKAVIRWKGLRGRGHAVSAGTGYDTAERPSGPEKTQRGPSRWRLALAAIIGAYVILAGYSLVSVFTSGEASLNSIASASTATPSAPARHPAPTTPQGLPTLATLPASHSLAVTSIAAFGPRGTADGDNPGVASRINATAAQPWYSSWYATPTFGNLKAGTGLLLDMGKAVTISSVQLVLGSSAGADVQVRVGNEAAAGDLTSVASASDVGKAVRLPVTPPSQGRYVLVWFTKLPPNTQGEYQVEVYRVTVDGTRG